ncbi:hypothetical protein IU448_28500 [Nocardia flavorosea]|uniref:hypothetical protein n=1 Tax=Nocardia flavorosea TaxID=53429 RepID=UPI001894D494|nr:hypothetical protein [Nocardia flavorosea]MBF6352922.1 hypothetical protein [Nocardia flavorosea]
MTAKTVLLTLFVCAALTLTACSDDEGVALEEDRTLSTQLADLRQNGGSVSLHELTGGDWDSVYVSHQPVSRDYVEREVGGKIDMDETFMQQGNILVFLRNGEVARAAYVIPDLLQPGKYSSSVRITADGYPALLEMSE